MRTTQLILLLAVLLPACEPRNGGSTEDPAVVRAATLESAPAGEWRVSGSVHARVESPLGFRVGGQILRREVSAGDRVEAGELLMALDPEDLRQQLRAARARLSSARAEAENAGAELARARRLRERELISESDFDAASTRAEAARERVSSARAQLEQARNALDYATLEAPAAGVITEILAEPGQVVAAGQAAAMLAEDGPREAEVYIPQEHRRQLPEKARAVVKGYGSMPARLRELAAAADPVTHTWRARYRLETDDPPPLGSIVRLAFSESGPAGPVYRIPLGALSERAEGARVWVIEDGRVNSAPVRVLRMDRENAYIRTDLPAGTQLVALGTHLLTENQPVEVAP